MGSYRLWPARRLNVEFSGNDSGLGKSCAFQFFVVVQAEEIDPIAIGVEISDGIGVKLLARRWVVEGSTEI